jgi:predicted ATPase
MPLWAPHFSDDSTWHDAEQPVSLTTKYGMASGGTLSPTGEWHDVHTEFQKNNQVVSVSLKCCSMREQMDGHIKLANKILNYKTNLNQLPVINYVTLHSLLSNSNKNMVFCDTKP